MPLGMEVGLSPGDFVLDGDPASPHLKGHSPLQLLSNVRYGQTTGWVKTPLGTEVDLVPGHIVLDEVPALRERGTAAPIFSAHVYCGHGRPSQLLLSSRLEKQCAVLILFSVLWADYVTMISGHWQKFTM